MAFQIKSFKDLLAMTEESLEESLIPLRVRSAKAKAESIKVDLETKQLELETKIHKACAEKDINFLAIAVLMDQYDLGERRLKQINNLLEQLFPTSE